VGALLSSALLLSVELVPTEASTIATPPMSMRRLSYAALMVALGLTGVYAETIPNFEVLTLVVFASGVLLGARDGALVGGVTMLIFTLLNPYGSAHPLVMLAQVTGEAVTGASGGVAARLGLGRARLAVRITTLIVLGLALTALFDTLTNVATGILFGQMRATLIGGIPFALWHMGTNAGLFGTLGAPLVGVLESYRPRLSS